MCVKTIRFSRQRTDAFKEHYKCINVIKVLHRLYCVPTVLEMLNCVYKIFFETVLEVNDPSLL